MDALTLTVLIVCFAIVVLAFVGAMLWQRRRSRSLREDFGPEYERTLRNAPSKNKAELELDERRRRVRSFDIRPLRPEQASRYREAWLGVQARFVDDPQAAIDDADRLLSDVMLARGYPQEDYERRVDDLSVNHPQTISGYRKAHGIARASRAGVQPDTDQLRRGLLDYRRVFMEMLEDTPRREVG